MKKSHHPAPWWRNVGVLGIIAFRAAVLGTATSTVLLVFLTARAYYQPTLPARFHIWQVVSDSFMTCAGWGMAVAVGFGIPAGIIDVLVRRERAVTLEQALETRQEEGSR